MTGAADKPAVRIGSPTEERNPRTRDLDRISTLEVLERVNEEDRLVPDAVRGVLPRVANAVDRAVEAIRSGGRVHYFGAGTSGRLAVLDAAELVPTFAAPRDWFVAHHAGGSRALVHAVEDVEDDDGAGFREADDAVEARDVVVGLTASGRTPFVAGALAAARKRGATTVLVTANPGAELATRVDVFIGVDTGPEVVTGSTRMKAGTAQKLVLNAFSTAVMVRLGRTYSNLMVDMVATNAKLRGRTRRILEEATGLGERSCEEALTAAGGELKTALVMLLARADPQRSREALQGSDGRVTAALDGLR